MLCYDNWNRTSTAGLGFQLVLCRQGLLSCQLAALVRVQLACLLRVLPLDTCAYLWELSGGRCGSGIDCVMFRDTVIWIFTGTVGTNKRQQTRYIQYVRILLLSFIVLARICRFDLTASYLDNRTALKFVKIVFGLCNRLICRFNCLWHIDIRLLALNSIAV